MKWALVGLGVIVALVLVVVIMGALLPRDHVASLAARVGAPPAVVWAALTDPAGFPAWRSDITRVELLGTTPNGPTWREYSRNGAITMVIDAAEPPRRLVTRIADDNLPFGGRWEFEIEPDGQSWSRVVVTERGSVYNPVFRFVSRFVMGHTKSIDTYLRALGRHFGNEPTPTIVAAGEAHGI
ncbi:MAG: SRPBCC family protein [bacterium]